MPTLPTFTVSDANAQRILAAFGSPENYRRWLKSVIIAKVQAYESTLPSDSLESELQ
jgi:hypothetical protein